jgi:VIT1/CCC1 family predicted Fe2+/Mn2+ transporter
MSAAAAREGWFQERQSAWLYRRLAAVEPDPRKRSLFEALAHAAEEQADTWRQTLGIDAAADAAFRPTLRARLAGHLLDQFGPRRMRAVLVALKLRGLSVYDAPLTPGHAMPTRIEDIGGRHRSFGGGNLRAAVFGANDGLVSNASLILGVAGAGVAGDTVLTTGIAGLLAGALSMAAGEYVSVRSQREMFEYQIGLERDELAEYPEEEAEELALIYAARGMDLETARRMCLELVKDPQHALDALAREELGLNPDDLGSPWGAAGFSFLAFSSGALVPLLPFFLGAAGMSAVWWSAGLAGVGLVGVGMAMSLFSGRQAWAGGLRMLAIGGGAGLIAFLIGRLLGVAAG